MSLIPDVDPHPSEGLFTFDKPETWANAGWLTEGDLERARGCEPGTRGVAWWWRGRWCPKGVGDLRARAPRWEMRQGRKADRWGQATMVRGELVERGSWEGIHPLRLLALHDYELEWLKRWGVAGWRDWWVRWQWERRRAIALLGPNEARVERMARATSALQDWQEQMAGTIAQWEEHCEGGTFGEKAGHVRARIAQFKTATTRADAERALTALDKLYGQYVERVEFEDVTARTADEAQREVEKRMQRMRKAAGE